MIGQFFENHRRIVVSLILLLGFTLGLFTMINDSAIVDEIAHIPAGYSYVRYQDFRLNPEHPPLIKDLAGLPLLLLDLEFPNDHRSWTDDVNGQWESGWHFLYHYGNNAEQILFFSRFPILLLTSFFGWCIYVLTRRRFGTHAALLALFLYALSPNIIAHGHFVTTDLGIALFIFLSLAAFAEFLIRPSGKTLLLATLALAGAQIAKFSAVLLYPFFFGILLIAVIAGKSTPNIPFLLTKKIRRPVIARFYGYLTSFVVMCVGSLLLVWAFYALHTLNFPPDKQIELIKVSMGHERAALVRELLTSMTQVPFLQPLAQYLLGVAMVFTRVAGGNTTFFLGEVTNQSFKWYFPVSYLIKEPLPLILMVILAAATAIRSTLAVKFRDYWRRFQTAVQGRVFELIMLAFIFFYGGISIMGNLNLGIRHLFPILPLISILASISAIKFFSGFRGAAGKKFAPVIFALLLAWYGLGTLATFPNYVSYFNEIVGGGKNGYRYMTDSNVDWGQDLKRFAIWLKTHPEIERIKLDYFGGGEPRYYFCDRTYDEQGSLIKNSSGYDCSNSIYQEWHANNGETIGWIAVSATFLQNSKYYKERFGEQDYAYLRSREPYARIGNSILVYWVR